MNYFSSTVDYNEDDLDNVCPDIAKDSLRGQLPTLLAKWILTCRTTTMTGVTLTRRSTIGKVRYIGSKECKTGTLTPTKYLVAPEINWYQEYVDEGFSVRGCLANGATIADQVSSHDGVSSGNGLEARGI